MRPCPPRKPSMSAEGAEEVELHRKIWRDPLPLINRPLNAKSESESSTASDQPLKDAASLEPLSTPASSPDRPSQADRPSGDDAQRSPTRTDASPVAAPGSPATNNSAATAASGRERPGRTTSLLPSHLPALIVDTRHALPPVEKPPTPTIDKLLYKRVFSDAVAERPTPDGDREPGDAHNRSRGLVRQLSGAGAADPALAGQHASYPPLPVDYAAYGGKEGLASEYSSLPVPTVRAPADVSSEEASTEDRVSLDENRRSAEHELSPLRSSSRRLYSSPSRRLTKSASRSVSFREDVVPPPRSSLSRVPSMSSAAADIAEPVRGMTKSSTITAKGGFYGAYGSTIFGNAKNAISSGGNAASVLSGLYAFVMAPDQERLERVLKRRHQLQKLIKQEQERKDRDLDVHCRKRHQGHHAMLKNDNEAKRIAANADRKIERFYGLLLKINEDRVFGKYHNFGRLVQRIDEEEFPEDRRPYFTYASALVYFVIMCASIWFNGGFESFSTNPFFGPSRATLVYLGAKYGPMMIEQNQYWRAVSAIWLHAGVGHFIIYMFIQYKFGVRLEKQQGALRTFVCYLLSGVGGFLASVVFVPSVVSVGPNGALYGVQAILLVDLLQEWRYRDEPGRELMTMLLATAITFMLGFLPQQDNYANLGGFVVGIFCGMVFLKDIHFGLGKMFVSLFGFLLLSLYFMAGFYWMYYATSSDPWCPSCMVVNCIPLLNWCDGSLAL